MKIPKGVIVVVSEQLGWHYTHRQIDRLFPNTSNEANAVNKVDKCSILLKAVNEDPLTNPLSVLGGVLETYMDYDIPTNNSNINEWEQGRERILKVLAQHGLSYHFGGTIRLAHAGVAVRTFEDLIRDRNLPAIETECARAWEATIADPAAGLTAACSLLESLFKVFIEDEGLEMPSSETIKPLWTTVSKQLGLDPAVMPDDDLKKILSGMTSVVDGLGSLRTHAGSAHGRGRKAYRVQPRHARLAVNAAHTLASFVLETWDARKRTLPTSNGDQGRPSRLSEASVL